MESYVGQSRRGAKRMRFREIRYRLRNDFQLAVLTLMSAVAVLGFSPFAIYRLLHLQWVPALLNAAIITSIVLTVLYAWRTGDTNRPSHFLMYVLGTIGVIGTRALGPLVVAWVYPMLVANFFLVHRHQALTVAIVYISALTVEGSGFPTIVHRFTFAVSSLLVCFYAYIFAYRTEVQRLQLENLAARDGLTGAYNRRTFQQELIRAHQDFARNQTVSGLLVIDIDYFKQVNDTWGHDAGDEVLIRLARLIEASVRKTDRFFRFGGEEFVLLVSPTKFESLIAIANHLRFQVERELNYEGRPITISIGGAILRSQELPDSWFSRADAALYRAKAEGRNRVVLDK